jgi:hypothetical protein
MPNHYYVISEVQFFNDKEDKNTQDFVSGTGIDLSRECHSRMPTLEEIKIALSGLSFNIEQQSYSDNLLEIKAINGTNVGLWLLFTNLENETTPINMFEIGRGSDPELAIDFIKTLTKTHGNFLYYFDGGKMSLVTDSKNKKTIMSELYSN